MDFVPYSLEHHALHNHVAIYCALLQKEWFCISIGWFSPRESRILVFVLSSLCLFEGYSSRHQGSFWSCIHYVGYQCLHSHRDPNSRATGPCHLRFHPFLVDDELKPETQNYAVMLQSAKIPLSGVLWNYRNVTKVESFSYRLHRYIRVDRGMFRHFRTHETQWYW